MLGSPICSCQCHWHLRSQDEGAALVAVVADLQEVVALGVLQGSHGEIVQQQDIDAGEPDQESADGAIGVRQGQLAKQFLGPFVQYGEAIAAGFLRQSTSQPTFCQCRWVRAEGCSDAGVPNRWNRGCALTSDPGRGGVGNRHLRSRPVPSSGRLVAAVPRRDSPSTATADRRSAQSVLRS